MLKTLFATTALATTIAWGAQAQTETQTEPEAVAPAEQMAPAAAEGTEATPAIVPETADSDMMAPADTEMAEPEAPADPAASEPATEMAEPEAPAVDPAASEPATEMAEPEAPAVDPAASEPATEMAQPDMPPLEEGWSQVDVATISADMLIGAEIRTFDQETVAEVEDVMLTADGMVEDVVARFGGFLGFGENTVLLGMDEITVVNDADGNVVVLTSLTPDDLKGRPEFVPEDEQG